MSERRTEIGSTAINVSRLGTGTNRWSKGSNDAAVLETYRSLLSKGIDLFDTAEIYGGGESERLIGECLRREDGRPVVASKYMPSSERTTGDHFRQALDATLKRIGVKTLDLYYIHFPPKAQTIEALMGYLAEAIDLGRIRAAGVSNFDAEQMRAAAAGLETRGFHLAANEVEYSLAHREPEENGVLDACKELGITLVAYRPLSRGSLAEKGGDGKLGEALDLVADSHSATAGQVSLAWLLMRDKNIIPIPGATKRKHAEENAAALDLALSKAEFDELDETSR